jgi:hypothetical protein
MIIGNDVRNISKRLNLKNCEQSNMYWNIRTTGQTNKPNMTIFF